MKKDVFTPWWLILIIFVCPLWARGDFNEDGLIDELDFAWLAAEWTVCNDPLGGNCGSPVTAFEHPRADLTADCAVNSEDYAALARVWLKENTGAGVEGFPLPEIYFPFEGPDAGIDSLCWKNFGTAGYGESPCCLGSGGSHIPTVSLNPAVKGRSFDGSEMVSQTAENTYTWGETGINTELENALINAESFTITMWIRGNNPYSTLSRLLKTSGLDLLHSDTHISLRVDTATAGAQWYSSTNVFDCEDRWLFIAITYDGNTSENQLKFYYGDLSTAVQPDTVHNANHGAIDPDGYGAMVTVGNIGSAGSRPFRGWIDELRIWTSHDSQDSAVLDLPMLEEVRSYDLNGLQVIYPEVVENANVYLPFEGEDNGLGSDCWKNQGITATGEGAQFTGARSGPLATVTPSGLKGQAMDTSFFTPNQSANVYYWGLKGSGETALEQALNGSQTMTISGWFYSTASTNTNGVVMYSTPLVLIHKDHWATFKTESSPWFNTSSGSMEARGVWRFFAVTLDATKASENVTLYTGSEGSSVAMEQKYSYDFGPDGIAGDMFFGLGFGYPTGSVDNPFVGYLDEVRIWNDSQGDSGLLSLDELEQVRLYDTGQQITEPLSYLKLHIPEDIKDLPTLDSQKYTVWEPSGWEDYTYVHNAIVSYWKGRLYVSWHSNKRGEWSPKSKGLVASAPIDDLTNWTEPVDLGAMDEETFLIYMRNRFSLGYSKEYIVTTIPRLMHATENRLYVWISGYVIPEQEALLEEIQPYSLPGVKSVGRIFYTEDPAGQIWHEVPLTQMDDYEHQQGMEIRHYGSNHHFARLRDGRLMSAHMVGPAFTSDPSGLTNWNFRSVDMGGLPSWHEPAAYEGPDGALHWILRKYDHISHSYSLDDGETWSVVETQPDFPDNPGNKEFGTFPNGWAWYVGNPVPFSPRTNLVLGISEDGWNFNKNYLVRWEPWRQLYPHEAKGHQPGYEYPCAQYLCGKMYIVYSHVRDFVELIVVDVSDILGE